METVKKKRRMTPAQLANLNRGYIKPKSNKEKVSFELTQEAIADIERAKTEKGISKAKEVSHRISSYYALREAFILLLMADEKIFDRFDPLEAKTMLEVYKVFQGDLRLTDRQKIAIEELKAIEKRGADR